MQSSGKVEEGMTVQSMFSGVQGDLSALEYKIV